MTEEIITAYYLCDCLCKSLNMKGNIQEKMTDSEVMTVALTAHMFFSGNYEKSRKFLKEHGYIKNMLSKSRFNRRLLSVSETVWQYLFHVLSVISVKSNPDNKYIIDSFPVPVCDNIRISRCKIYRGKEYRGRIACRRRYFYGIRVHMLITETGQPVEFILEKGSSSDVKVLKNFNFDIPEGSVIYGDKIYNDYKYEDLLNEAAGILLQPLRKKNLKRQSEPWVRYIQQKTRKKIESVFSVITGLFPKVIHAVTPGGFELKIFLFVVSFAIQKL